MRALAAAALVALAAGGAGAQEIGEVLEAKYADPTDRYGHQIFGEVQNDWAALEVTVKTGKRKRDKEVRRFVLPHERVFEDLAPRLADVDGDGTPEVIVVEAHLDHGARLAIYDENGFVAAGGWIGQRERWLAPIGAADIDGDGRVEIGYVDRPHLRKVLAIYRYADKRLDYVIEITPFTNHRLGEDVIVGGVRTCKGVSSFVVGNGDMTQVLSVTLTGDKPQVRALGNASGPESFARAVECKKP